MSQYIFTLSINLHAKPAAINFAARIHYLIILIAMKQHLSFLSGIACLFFTATTAAQTLPTKEELKGFAKTNLQKPGELQTLKFTFTPAELVSFYTDKEAWGADPGNYTVKAGVCSADIRLMATFNLPDETDVEKVNRVLVPKAGINELKSIADNEIVALNDFAATNR